MTLVKCKNCEKTFEKIESEIKRYKNHFCCNECSNLYRRKENKYIRNTDYTEIIINSAKYGEVRVLIDDEDVEKVKLFHWALSPKRNALYVRSSKNKKQPAIFLHRLITNCPIDMVVDHINHSPLDNRKSNLKICTERENLQNKPIPKTNKSHHLGVRKRGNRYVAEIFVNYKTKHLGSFITLDKAIKARKIAENLYFKKVS